MYICEMDRKFKFLRTAFVYLFLLSSLMHFDKCMTEQSQFHINFTVPHKPELVSGLRQGLNKN